MPDELGRWAEPGLLVLASLAEGDKHGYAITQDIAAQHVRALAFRVIADQIDSGELDARLASVSFAA